MALMSSLASYITDKLREKGVSITMLRKVNNSIGKDNNLNYSSVIFCFENSILWDWSLLDWSHLI